ncbi:amino acid adenylation domain-containing protein [Kitasatospora sp. NPDC101183]|uniref:amino acid adenylation domain-containing protein n=1 Tax=Kitasatospora sp. NPDC101183 TaxID=3364100 RepID=UPI00382662D2
MSLHRLVLEAAARHPERVAVSGPDATVTYRELSRRANELAGRLAAQHVGVGDRVVVWASKSAECVAAMQAVLRLGAVYVPVDGSTPPARVAAIVRDCLPAAVCIDPENVSRLTPAERGCPESLVLGGDFAAPAGPFDYPSAAEDLAYVLYTSGSTGRPKGVRVTHGNARAFVDWWVTELAALPEDRFANHAPFGFDLSVLDLYGAFAAGASVHLVPTELSYAPEHLTRFLRERGISIWYSVPSALSLMIREGGLLDDRAPSCLRAVLFAGEPCPIPTVRELAAWTGARLLNLYGPTETNVCTFHEVTTATLEMDRPPPIGKASSGNTVWAVTDNGQTAGVGEEGELLVTGPTVMPGYWGRPPLTGPYRTGDLVRVLPDGSFDYLGRQDGLVKLRGHRVELGEVEATIAQHPEVLEAAAVVAGAGLSRHLDVFVATRGGAAPGVLSLKRHVAERLPRYMIPDIVHHVPALPRTSNGKIDRTALAARADSATKEKLR